MTIGFKSQASPLYERVVANFCFYQFQLSRTFLSAVSIIENFRISKNISSITTIFIVVSIMNLEQS